VITEVGNVAKGEARGPMVKVLHRLKKWGSRAGGPYHETFEVDEL